MRCKDVPELLDICDRFLPMFNSNDVAFALYRLAKLQGGRDLGIDMPLATSMLARAVIDMSNDEFNPKCLANTSWGLATLLWNGQPALQIASKQTLSRLAEFRP